MSAVTMVVASTTDDFIEDLDALKVRNFLHVLLFSTYQ
jgi:hypothetical protein